MLMEPFGRPSKDVFRGLPAVWAPGSRIAKPFSVSRDAKGSWVISGPTTVDETLALAVCNSCTPDSTTTVVDAAPISSLAFNSYVRPTVIFTSVNSPVLKPSLVTVTVYTPGVMVAMTKRPSDPEVAVTVAPVLAPFAVTVAPGIVAPEGSVTVPTRVPVGLT